MARLQTSFILGYHGCSEDVANKVLSGQTQLLESDREYDWLGPGTYFWESDPQRAWEWADAKVARGSYKHPCVVGAVIDLGNCLDLMARDSLDLLKEAYISLLETHRTSGLDPLPKNMKARGDDPDKLLRYLDCAVIRRLHSAFAESGFEPYDSVRGLFSEGGELFPGSGFKAKTHVQIAVRNIELVKGYFRVPRPS